MNKITLEIGKRFGKLTVEKEGDRLILPSGQINRTVVCVCDCGNEKTVRLLHLIRGRISSCGCIVKTKNGEGKSLLCKVWRSMKDRTKESYTHGQYATKKIKMTKEWENWEIFKNWALANGYKKGLQIDRINNDGDYCPENCRFVTFRENQNNRDITIKVKYKGEEYPITVILEKLNRLHDYATIVSRIKRGWEHERALDLPVKQGNYKRKHPLQ